MAFHRYPFLVKILDEFIVAERESRGSVGLEPISVLRAYLERLRDSNTPLPRWGGSPNKLAIARACGIERNVFYDHPKALQLLSAYAERETSSQVSMVTVSPPNHLQVRSSKQSPWGDILERAQCVTAPLGVGE